MKVDVLILHGIAKIIRKDAYTPFIDGIDHWLPLHFDVKYHQVDYSYLLQKKEEQIFGWMEPLPYKKLTNFGAFFVADALAYAYPKHHPTVEGDFIYDVNKLLCQKLGECRDDSKKVIIGHSLGSIVGYGISWDIHIDCLITMGSPFFYFSPRYKDNGEMNPDLAQFHNFWKSTDKVSCGPISKNPKFASVHDYRVKSMNPKYLLPVKAHSSYWTSKYVHEKIASIIQGLYQ